MLKLIRRLDISAWLGYFERVSISKKMHYMYGLGLFTQI